MKKNKYKFTFLLLLFSTFLVLSTVSFYNGFHNVDLAQNFCRLGYTHDEVLSGEVVELLEIYKAGTQQMIAGFFMLLVALAVSLPLKRSVE